MVEIRREITKGEWSIIAPTRSDRPFDFSGEKKEGGAANANCPFCPGNEPKTPPEIFAIREGGGESDWKVRVFPNKYPALDKDGTAAVIEGDLYESMGGFGHHEVVAETPRHDVSLDQLGVEDIELVIRTYIERARDLVETREIKYVSIFRNQGKQAGASLSHPHSQIMATTFVPGLPGTEHRISRDFHERTGDCMHCRLIEAEKSEEERIVTETEGFFAFSPFGARFPYETHLYPKSHRSDFKEIESDEIGQFAKALKLTLGAMREKFGDFFPYNYYIHTGPSASVNQKEDLEKSYHWHLEIIPRLTTPAGFEWGSGNFINIIGPERGARELRQELA